MQNEELKTKNIIIYDFFSFLCPSAVNEVEKTKPICLLDKSA